MYVYTIVTLIIGTAKNCYYYDSSAFNRMQLNYAGVMFEYGAIPNGNDEGQGNDTDICRGSSSVCNVSFALIAIIISSWSLSITLNDNNGQPVFGIILLSFTD